MNPAAGRGILPDAEELDGEVYITERPGDASEFIKNKLSDGNSYHIYAYGGDGTQNEIVNGVMEADAGKRVVLTPMPTGSGNDFYRISSKIRKETPCDLIRFNGKYVLNVLNIGFDCAVAARMNDYKNKPLVSGSFAYILGVAAEFVKKTPTRMKIEITDAFGRTEYYEDDYLLCAIANGKFYGGGFKAAPAADISDGMLDVVLVKNISRRRFISLVGDYKNGTHINEDTLECNPRLADVLHYFRAVKIKITGAERYSADGEILDNDSGVLEIDVVHDAISVTSEKCESESFAEQPVMV